MRSCTYHTRAIKKRYVRAYSKPHSTWWGEDNNLIISMTKIRHASLEQTPIPPQRLPRLVAAPAVSSPASPPRHSQASESLVVTRSHRKSEEAPPRTPQSSTPRRPPISRLYDHNAHTYTAADARKVRMSNLKSVTSGVAVKDFYEDRPDLQGDEAERRKPPHLSEYKQRRKGSRESKASSSLEFDNDSVSYTKCYYGVTSRSPPPCCLLRSTVLVAFTPPLSPILLQKLPLVK